MSMIFSVKKVEELGFIQPEHGKNITIHIINPISEKDMGYRFYINGNLLIDMIKLINLLVNSFF